MQKVIEETEKKIQLQRNELQLVQQQAENQIKALKQRIANLEQDLSEEKENSKSK